MTLHTITKLPRDGLTTEGHKDKDRGREEAVLNGRVDQTVEPSATCLIEIVTLFH